MKFAWKLVLGYVGLILLTAGIVGVLLARWLEIDSKQQTAASLKAKTVLLEDFARPRLSSAGASEPELQARIGELAREVETRFTVIRADGLVVADSERDPATMDDHSNRPEVEEAARTRTAGQATRYSKTVQAELMYYARPVLDEEGELLGFVRAALPLTDLENRLVRLRSYVFLGAGVAILAGLIPGVLLARRVTHPLSAMTRAAQSIAAGDYGHQLPAERSRDEIGELARTFSLMSDQLRERMQTIEADRGKLLAILSSMVEGVVAIDSEERIVHLNEVAARLLLSEGQSGIGARIGEACQVQEVCEAFRRTLREGEITRGELTLPAQPSNQVIQLLSSPLRDAEGVTGAVMVLHDVSQVRRLERVRREFVANVSHELKTPLTAVSGLVETLLEDPEMDAETHRRFLEKVRNQSARLGSLVGDLLTLSRVETEGEALDLRPFDLRDALGESARGLLPAQEEKGIEFDLDMPHEPVRVRGDPEALRQVVDNLLSNANKYTPAGGKVWLRLIVEQDAAVIEVEDTGIGLAPAEQERIFERFYRVDKARSRELGGTGLGLSIVKHIVLAHGGGVSVQSSPGQGSTFRVRIALLDEVARPEPAIG